MGSAVHCALCKLRNMPESSLTVYLATQNPIPHSRRRSKCPPRHLEIFRGRQHRNHERIGGRSLVLSSRNEFVRGSVPRGSVNSVHRIKPKWGPMPCTCVFPLRQRFLTAFSTHALTNEMLHENHALLCVPICLFDYV